MSKFLNIFEKMRLEIEKKISSKAPVDTGKLKGNGKCSEVKLIPGKAVFEWTNETFYAGFVIYGTGKKHRLKKAYNPAYTGKGRRANLYPYLAIAEVTKKYRPKLAKAIGEDTAKVIVKSLSFK